MEYGKTSNLTNKLPTPRLPTPMTRCGLAGRPTKRLPTD